MPLQDDIAKLYLQEHLSDFRFRLDDGPPIPAHRLVCCSRSDVLRAMLAGPFQEASAPEVPIPCVQRDAFLELLRFLYTDAVELGARSVVHACVLADRFMLPEMHGQCTRRLSGLLDDCSNFWEIFVDAVALSCEPAVAACLRFMSSNAEELVQSSPGSTLSLEALKVMMAKMPCVREVELFSFCVRWADAVSDNRREALRDVLPLLRLPLLSHKDLATQVADSGVLTETEQLALFRHIATEGLRSSGFLADQREPSGTSFVYSSDLDMNGVIYWIGTLGRTKEFSNPHISGLALVSASSQLQFGYLHNVVSRLPAYTRLGSIPDSWFAVDLAALGTKRLNVVRYTLQHGRDTSQYSLRSWVLEGSEDGAHWIVLDQRNHDRSLNGGWATASWDVSTEEFVRHVRVRTTGPVEGGSHFFHLAGLELYGKVIGQNSLPESRKRPRTASD